MDWNTLPDLIALTVLAAAFASLLPRNVDRGLRLWLVGWALIVMHFIARFCDASGQQTWIELIALWSLQGAGLAFMWGVVWGAIGRTGPAMFAAFAVPQLAFGALAEWNVQAAPPYLVALACIAMSPIAVSFASLRNAYHRTMVAGSTLALVAPLGATLAFDRDPTDGVNVLLAWVYFTAGFLYWRRFKRRTVGVATTVFGFATWGLVFPLGVAQSLWFANVHIDATAWNIPKYVVAIGLILTLLEEQLERSNFIALHDELTGLPNRRYFEDRLERCIERARRDGSTFALLTIDLDRFKAVNDNFGHHAGDEFLRAVAARFERETREGDMCFRYGGDEFAVIAEGVGERCRAERLARDLIDALTAPIALHGIDVVAAASVGVAMFPEDGRDADALHAASDVAMYLSKRSRNVAYARR